MCWAFSCASMLRASCSILIKKLFGAGKIDQQRKNDCLTTIMKPEVHTKIRNLIAMVLLPRKLHKNDESQATFLRAAVSRVGHRFRLTELADSQIANPTVLEKPGALMLAPIYQLLFGENELRHWMKTLELVEDQVSIFYKTYRSDNQVDMQAIVDQQLTPGNKLQ